MRTSSLITSFFGLAMASSVVGIANTKLQVREDPDDLLIFVCDQGLDEICTNMCYGAYCAGITESLMYDQPTPDTKRNRRKAAGCIASGGNRCSVKQGYSSGFQCDEYPFASSISNGGASTRLNRCVPAAQNRMQGGIISAFYRSSYCTGNNGGLCQYTVEFSNAGNIKYCDMQNCGDADSNEVVGPGGDADPDDTAGDDSDGDSDAEEKRKRQMTRRSGLGKRLVGAPVYRTSSGLELDIPGGAQIGQRAFIALPRNVTLWNEQAKSGPPGRLQTADDDEDDEDEDYDYMLANLDMREDTIVEEIIPSA